MAEDFKPFFFVLSLPEPIALQLRQLLDEYCIAPGEHCKFAVFVASTILAVHNNWTAEDFKRLQLEMENLGKMLNNSNAKEQI